MARSVGPTRSFQVSTIAAANATNGRTTAVRLAFLWSLDIELERTDGSEAALLRPGTCLTPTLVRMNNRPWSTLSERVTAPLRPRVPTLVGEVIDAVQSAVPEYEALDPAVSRGGHVALDGFLHLVEGGDETRLPGRDVYVRFGQAEARNGRSLDALLTAYRAGARVAWRGFASAGHLAGVDPEALYTLAEAIFAYIDEISAASAEGHAREQSLAAREQQERRRRLVEALLQEPQPPEVAALAAVAGWELPDRVAALAFDADAPERVDARLAAFGLVARMEGIGWALVDDPYAPGRRAELERALDGHEAALGPGGPRAEGGRSARRARLALGLGLDGLAVAEDH